ncbi:MAG TPA: TAXI family TRAP transporter solute-binding subunit [Dongiaceae bacterium]|nr:TAXI family TRAP transporter solute-binding subunit [Dongiaceae bacterium]
MKFRTTSGTRARVIWLGGAFAAGAVALAAYLLPGSGLDKAFAQDVAYFRIGAGAPGSTLYDLAGEIASAISNPPGSRQCDNDGPCGVEGVIGLAQTATDPVSALQSVDGGVVESVIVSADIADAAVQGTGPFKKSGPMTELRSIGNVGQLVLHVLVAKEAPFADLSALNGKRIAIGVKDSDNAVTARSLLRVAGINEKKTKLVTGDPEAAALDLLGDKVDALVLVAQLPNADVASLMRTGSYKLLPAKPSDDNKSGYVTAGWIKHKQYAGTDVVPTLSVPAVWVVRSSLSDELADGLAKALLHAAGNNDKIQPSIDRLTVPLHAGAQAALAALGQAEEVQAPAPEPPQPDATN